jgi:hypothetical protein
MAFHRKRYDLYRGTASMRSQFTVFPAEAGIYADQGHGRPPVRE